MTNEEMLTYVDHTLLKPTATWNQIKTLCEEAMKYHTASVCIPCSFISRAHEAFPELNLCTVVGFPLGYSTTASKLFETREALHNGASEIDMVVNLGDVKEGNFDKVTQEIRELKKACGDKILKVIIETCYLTEEEKIELCHCVTDGGADFIKTSTGFGSAGATFDDIKLFREHIGPGVKIKAAGGIRTYEDIVTYIELGCDRLGCSAAIKVLGD
ncbi:MAG: deoxyribose-phosphate aldolase [Solobacterium sp.]|nr:deoxyribose-phosphate aldolase [Solobacterium sp.]MDD6496870.1 deoxyribose-phosphate aldolase [Solobacterium sp.]MDY5654141.1 deoxyribose-phosphate aldolase [Erysipelotrichaceae bacterium]